MTTALTIKGNLASAVLDAGTFTVNYPARPAPDFGVFDEGAFYNSMSHSLVMGQGVLAFPNKFDLTLGTASITVTNKSGATWAAGTDFILELNIAGKPIFLRDVPGGSGKKVNRSAICLDVLVNLGSPDTAAANGLTLSQSVTTLIAAPFDGAIGQTLDVPRNVVGAWTGTSVVTVTGFDEYGQAMKESSASGTTFTGKKAFKKITSIIPVGSITLATFGTGDVLGLPVFLPNAGNVVREMQDGAAPTAGTLVAGIRTAGGSVATSGDVRGTYDPNAACDGDKAFQLLVSLPDPQFLGMAQYAG
jgi:hypothetical protein